MRSVNNTKFYYSSHEAALSQLSIINTQRKKKRVKRRDRLVCQGKQAVPLKPAKVGISLELSWRRLLTPWFLTDGPELGANIFLLF